MLIIELRQNRGLLLFMQLNRNERITMVRKNFGFSIDVQKVHLHEYAVMTYDQYNAALKLYSEKKQKLPIMINE
jgi:hypothetical protein